MRYPKRLVYLCECETRICVTMCIRTKVYTYKYRNAASKRGILHISVIPRLEWGLLPLFLSYTLTHCTLDAGRMLWRAHQFGPFQRSFFVGSRCACGSLLVILWASFGMLARYVGPFQRSSFGGSCSICGSLLRLMWAYFSDVLGSEGLWQWYLQVTSAGGGSCPRVQSYILSLYDCVIKRVSLCHECRKLQRARWTSAQTHAE